MKTRILRAGLCLFVIGAIPVLRSSGQAVPANAPASTNGIGPRIQFDSLDYVFGNVRGGTKVTHDYVFTNTGDAKLQVTSVQPGCHCTTVGQWTHEVEPGKTGVIPLQFDSTGFGGPIFRATTVTCNDKIQPTVRLQLHGTVNRPVDVSPSFVLLNIGPDASEETNGIVHITNNEEQPLQLTPPTSSTTAFTAELKTNTPGKSYDLIIKTVPPLASGNNQSVITVGTLSTNAQPIRISAVAIVQPLVAAMPPEITVPAGPLKTNMTISVSLQNKSSHLVTLSEPSVNAAGATATVTASRPGLVFTASVEFPAGFVVPLGTQFELSIKTDNPRHPVVKIPIKPGRPFAPTSVRVMQ